MMFLLFLFALSTQAQQTVERPACASAFCEKCLQNETTKCTKCIDKYYPNQNGECVLDSELNHCLTRDIYGNFYCLKCVDGYKIDPTTKTCVKGLELCESYSRSSEPWTCNSCLPGYTITEKSECVHIEMPGCKKFVNSTGLECSECYPNYKKENNGTCTLYDEFCAQGIIVRGQFECYSCLGGYYIGDDKKCVKGEIEHCVMYEDGSCILCEKNMISALTVCLEPKNVIPKCVFYEDQNNCAECEDNYEIVNGKCVSKKCVKTDSATKKCTQCGPEYYLKEDFTCAKCDLKKCPNGCKYTADNCINFSDYYTIPDCKVYSEDLTKCLVCDSNKMVFQGKCVDTYTRDVRCYERNGNGVCVKCFSNSYKTSPKYYFLPTNGLCQDVGL